MPSRGGTVHRSDGSCNTHYLTRCLGPRPCQIGDAVVPKTDEASIFLMFKEEGGIAPRMAMLASNEPCCSLVVMLTGRERVHVHRQFQ